MIQQTYIRYRGDMYELTYDTESGYIRTLTYHPGNQTGVPLDPYTQPPQLITLCHESISNDIKRRQSSKYVS